MCKVFLFAVKILCSGTIMCLQVPNSYKARTPNLISTAVKQDYTILDFSLLGFAERNSRNIKALNVDLFNSI